MQHPSARGYPPAHDLHAPTDPYYAPLFRHVHPLCWPILWWSLNRFFRWYDTSGYESLLLATTRWGYVYPAYLGEKKPDPSAWRPYEPERPRWDDPVWAMSAPAALVGIASAEALRLLCALTERACTLTLHNTS